jgi:hypothetical protein
MFVSACIALQKELIIKWKKNNVHIFSSSTHSNFSRHFVCPDDNMHFTKGSQLTMDKFVRSKGETRKRSKLESSDESSPRSVKKSKSNENEIVFIFAHGAGAPSSSQWMKDWAKRLSIIGNVHSFDYDYMKKGKKVPDKLDKLIEQHMVKIAC